MSERNTRQAVELLIYLGVEKYGKGRRYLSRCFVEIESGVCPGVEVYETVARDFGCSAAQVVAQCQRVLSRARKKCPQKWEELFPELDPERTGLTLFLCHAAEWLQHNRIEICRQGHDKRRMPVPKT